MLEIFQSGYIQVYPEFFSLGHKYWSFLPTIMQNLNNMYPMP
jgi:hypothetical protein